MIFYRQDNSQNRPILPTISSILDAIMTPLILYLFMTGHTYQNTNVVALIKESLLICTIFTHGLNLVIHTILLVMWPVSLKHDWLNFGNRLPTVTWSQSLDKDPNINTALGYGYICDFFSTQLWASDFLLVTCQNSPHVTHIPIHTKCDNYSTHVLIISLCLKKLHRKMQNLMSFSKESPTICTWEWL